MVFPQKTRIARATVVCAMVSGAVASLQAQVTPDRAAVLSAMKRAATFMNERVSTQGGYVWSYLPDRSRRWGEMEAYASMIWIQPPGTTTMGHAFLDAYHATGDSYYYGAAMRVAQALIAAQHPAGGWHYFHDFDGPASRERWYQTIGRNAWRLEEFQHDWGNATFDDGGTADATRFLLRLYVEQRDEAIKRALERAVGFILDSQYPNGAWPQRYPIGKPFEKHGHRDYTGYLTFNDDVAAGNIETLTWYYQVCGGERVHDAIGRAMRAFVVTQQPAPQAGWALQHTPDGKPAGARTYEPEALATHTTASNVEHLMAFYRETGDASFLARIPEALDWLERVALPASLAAPNRTHPTFVEVGTDQPLFVHRRGSNAINGAYFADRNPNGTIAHYSSFRVVDVAGLRARLAALKALPAAEVTKGSRFLSPQGSIVLPTYVTLGPGRPGRPEPPRGEDRVPRILAALNADGYWPSDLGSTSHPYTRDGSPTPAPGDYSQSHVGDETDTSPFRATGQLGITTGIFVRNMAELIRFLDRGAEAR